MNIIEQEILNKLQDGPLYPRELSAKFKDYSHYDVIGKVLHMINRNILILRSDLRVEIND